MASVGIRVVQMSVRLTALSFQRNIGRKKGGRCYPQCTFISIALPHPLLLVIRELEVNLCQYKIK